MLRRSNYLPFLVLASFTIILLLSCSQSKDIVTPISTTEIALTAERLPTPPSGMVYELWVAKSEDTVSLGKFSYNSSTREFLDLLGAVRSDTFVLQGDIYSYTDIFVSIETNPDANPAEHGPIMLIDNVSNPTDDPMKLRFPEADSLWNSTLKFNFETPTDLNRNTNLGHGLWFTRYQLDTLRLPDTVGQHWSLVDSTVDSTKFPFRYACSVTDTTYDTVQINLGGPEFLWMGATVPKHLGVQFNLTNCVDSFYPLDSQVVVGVFDTIARLYPRDWFNQAGALLPNVSRYGWHYKGWVVTPYNQAGMTTKWRFTKPAYQYNTPNEKFIPGDTGVLFSTGTFTDIFAPDDANPFSLSHPTPPFPGEDFLNSTALHEIYGIDSVNLVPLTSGNIGTVFITLEPNNFTTDTTNFPLIAMLAPVPARRALIGGNVAFDMSNFTSTIGGNTIGFPMVMVSIKRF